MLLFCLVGVVLCVLFFVNEVFAEGVSASRMLPRNRAEGEARQQALSAIMPALFEICSSGCKTCSTTRNDYPGDHPGYAAQHIGQRVPVNLPLTVRHSGRCRYWQRRRRLVADGFALAVSGIPGGRWGFSAVCCITAKAAAARPSLVSASIRNGGVTGAPVDCCWLSGWVCCGPQPSCNTLTPIGRVHQAALWVALATLLGQRVAVPLPVGHRPAGTITHVDR